MKRKPVKPSKDKKVFSRTAKKTKRINLNASTVPRGGIRL